MTQEKVNKFLMLNTIHFHTTKLEALLAKPIEDLPHPSEKGLNGESPRTEGV